MKFFFVEIVEAGEHTDYFGRTVKTTSKSLHLVNENRIKEFKPSINTECDTAN